MDSIGLWIIVSVALPALISLGEIMSGKIMGFTLTSVLATRRQLPNAFMKLVLIKMGIYISILVLGGAVLLFVITVWKTSTGPKGGALGKVVFVFLVIPIVMFARKFNSLVRLESKRAHRRARHRKEVVT
jgi:hypothetical protein